MRLQIISDLHLEYGDYRTGPTMADAVVLAGDIGGGCNGIKWAKERFPDKVVIYVPGNHEFYNHTVTDVLTAIRNEAHSSNVVVLENESVQIGWFTFLGCCLWTDFSLWPDAGAAMQAAEKSVPDYWFIETQTGNIRAEDTARLHRESLRWLKDALGKVNPKKAVIVSHHAPSEKSLLPGYAGEIKNAAYASALDEFIKESGVPLWVHGHTHLSMDYMIGRTRIFSNQRGFPQKPDPGFKPDAVIEVQAI